MATAGIRQRENGWCEKEAALLLTPPSAERKVWKQRRREAGGGQGEQQYSGKASRQRRMKGYINTVYTVWGKFPQVFLGFAVLPNHFKTIVFLSYVKEEKDFRFWWLELHNYQSRKDKWVFLKQCRSGIKAHKQSALCVHPDESLTAGMLLVDGVVVILTAALWCKIPLFTLRQHFWVE